MKKKLHIKFICLVITFFCLIQKSVNCQSTYSTLPLGIKIVGGLIMVNGLWPCIVYGNTATVGINYTKLSGSEIKYIETFPRLYAGLAVGVTSYSGGFECLIEVGASYKGVKQDISRFGNLPQIDPDDQRYHDPYTFQSADKLDELYLNYFRFAVLPKIIIVNSSFLIPTCSAGISFEIPNIFSESHGGLVIQRHGDTGLYNGILSGDVSHLKFINYNLIGGLGFDIAANGQRIFGAEVRYNYGLNSITKTSNLEKDTFKLRDKTWTIILHIYFPSLHTGYSERYF
jgi:hypothetical protein